MSLNIIYVDDEKDLLEIFADMFMDQDIKIKTFNDPNEAKKYVTSNLPDLILLDFRMPEISGEQLAVQLSSSLNIKVPIALVSGDLHVKTNYKFDKVFKKPFDYQMMHDYFASLRKE